MKNILFAFMLLFSLSSFADTQSSCKSPDEISSKNSVLNNPGRALTRSEPLQVTCCCNTSTGGMCCNEVAGGCVGTLVPGCICRLRHDNNQPEDSFELKKS
jgi:hypothetical protein